MFFGEKSIEFPQKIWYTVKNKVQSIKNTVANAGKYQKEKIENYYGFEQPISGTKLMENGVNQYLNLGGNIITDEVVGLTYFWPIFWNE